MELYKSSYRIIKSQWGIAIDITGEITLFDKDKEKGYRKIDDGLWIRIISILKCEEKEYIYTGLKDISKLIINASPYKNNTLIRIHAIDYNPCDYQIEGLIPAIYQWISGILTINTPKIETKFNKSLNKYEFIYSSDI